MRGYGPRNTWHVIATRCWIRRVWMMKEYFLSFPIFHKILVLVKSYGLYVFVENVQIIVLALSKIAFRESTLYSYILSKSKKFFFY